MKLTVAIEVEVHDVEQLRKVARERMDAACELWEEARRLEPEFPSILYNLGVCAESQGNFARALDFYRKADKALGNPDDNINAALKRVTAALKSQKKLEEQLCDQ